MKDDHSDLIEQLKEYRRDLVYRLDEDLTPSIARDLAATHTAILAIEAVMAEPEPIKTGPILEFGEDGYPK